MNCQTCGKPFADGFDGKLKTLSVGRTGVPKVAFRRWSRTIADHTHAYQPFFERKETLGLSANMPSPFCGRSVTIPSVSPRTPTRR